MTRLEYYVGALFACCILFNFTACQNSSREPEQQPKVDRRILSKAISGYAYQSIQEQRLQDDKFANPGYLWVDKGKRLFDSVPAGATHACADCHKPDMRPIQGVAARYPSYDLRLSTVLNLEQRINACRVDHQKRPRLNFESDELLSLSAYVANQSSGAPISVEVEGAAHTTFEAGRDYYYRRKGQLNLACNHCHEYNPGRMLRGDRLSQGQPTGYPSYKLEWQTLGSLQRRLRDCDVGVRAQPFDYGAPEYVALELFLAWRATGLPIETPAVRR